jgi:amphi-Trp domain-containing protein
VASGIPVRFRGRARRDAAAFYLSQLAKGVLSGELPIVAGEHETSLVTTEYLLLEIEVKQKKRANHVAMKLRWPRRPLIRAGGTLRATPPVVGDLRERGRDGES